MKDRFSVSISRELHEELRMIAEKRGSTKSGIIEEALKAYLHGRHEDDGEELRVALSLILELNKIMIRKLEKIEKKLDGRREENTGGLPEYVTDNPWIPALAYKH